MRYLGEDLVDKLGGPDFYRYVMELAALGPAALPAVRAGMGHTDWRIRRGCAAVIFHLSDEESLRRLVLLTRDPKKKVRKAAVLSLGIDGQKNGNVPFDPVPHLAYNVLHDPAVRVRRVAVIMLMIQAPERRIARILRKVLAAETDPQARRVAGWGLQQVQARLSA